MRIVESNRRDPSFNLALEEHLLEQREGPETFLLFYVNEPALVIGKNQNPWRECDVARARRENVPVLRRFSGGGAVFHDAGNLNYSIITPRAGYRQDETFAMTLRGLRRAGIEAARMGKSSLAVGDRKISGTAFCFRRDTVVHHGTLLVQSDLARMARLLEPGFPEIDTRAIASNPAPVANLAELQPGLNLRQIISALCDELAPGAPRVDETRFELAAVDVIAARRSAWDHVYGETPTFTVRVPAGGEVLEFIIVQGCVTRASRGPAGNVPELIGCRFDSAVMADHLRSFSGKSGDLSNLAAAIQSMGF